MGRATSLWLVAIGLLAPPTLQAQRLFTPIETASSVQSGQAAAGDAGAVSGAFTRVEADLDFLRSGPERLELQVPGSRETITVERTVFEDRGDGNALWTGRVSDADYDTVVLTLQDGYLVGTYGRPGEPKYRATIGSAGEGALISRPRGMSRTRETCREPLRDSDTRSGGAGAAAAGSSASVSDRDLKWIAQPQNEVRQLDLLVLYTFAAETYFDERTAFEADVRNLIDYTNTAFSNSSLNSTVRLANLSRLPSDVDTSTVCDSGGSCSSMILDSVTESVRAGELRSRYKADAVMVLHDDDDVDYCGEAWVRVWDDTTQSISEYAFGMMIVGCDDDVDPRGSLFAHELAHNLGANHDPDNTSRQPVDAVYSYAYGHNSSAFEEKTIMSYGRDLYTEPYFSSTDFAPSGWRLGIANQRENARALRQTLSDAVLMSVYLPPDYPPESLTLTGAEVGDTATVTLNWTDRSTNETTFKVEYRTRGSSTWLAGAEVAEDVTTAAVSGLQHDTVYEFRVGSSTPYGQKYTAAVAVNPSVPPPSVVLEARLVHVANLGRRAELTWTLGGGAATSLDISYRIPGGLWLPDAENDLDGSEASALFRPRQTRVYEFRVAAANASGSASSNVVTVDFAQTVPAVSGLGGATATSTSASLTWSDDSEEESGFAVQVRPHGTTAWTTHLTLDANTIEATVTGLAENGIFDFRVEALTEGDISAYSNTVSLDLSVQPPRVTLAGRLVHVAGVGLRAELKWTNSGDPSSWLVLWFSADQGPWTEDTYQSFDGTETSTLFEPDPNPGVYDLVLDAWNAGGWGLSNVVTVDFTQTVPAVSGLVGTAATSTSASLTWIDDSAHETGFEVQGRVQGTTAWTVLASVPADAETATATGLAEDEAFEFRVRAVIEDGAAAYSNLVTLDLSVAAPIMQLSADFRRESQDEISAVLTWTVSGAPATIAVEERAAGDESWTVRETVSGTDTSTTLSGITEQTELRLSASNAGGLGHSNVVTVDVSLLAPRPPGEVLAEQTGPTEVTLSWTDQSSGETGFRIRYRGYTLRSSWSTYAVVPANSTSVRVTGLRSLEWGFIVEAVNQYGVTSHEVVDLEIEDERPFPPKAASRLAGTQVSATEVALEWKDRSGKETAFDVAWRPEDGDWTYVAVAENTVSKNVSSLAADGVYVFRVLARSRQGSHDSNWVTVDLGLAAPVSVKATAVDETSVEVTWDDESLSETAFMVEYRKKGASTWSSVTAPGDADSATITGLERGTTYEVRVRATRAGREGQPSEVVSVSTAGGVGPDAAPSGLSVAAQGSTSVKATWTDNSSNETGFVLQYRKPADEWTDGATVVADMEAVTLTGLSPSVAYEFRVRARNEYGTLETSVVTVTMPPAAPSNLAATQAAATSVNLSWKDNSVDETGFKLEYRRGNGRWSTAPANASADAESATLGGLRARASYRFRVTATNSNGDSTPSNIVSLALTQVSKSLVITGIADATVAENAAFTSATPTVSGHTGAVTWTLEGTDAADFTINGATGVVSMIARNHEDPADGNTDSVYEVTVKATDADNVVGTVSFTVTVTDVNEAPTFAAGTALALSVAEGTTGNIGSPVAATDPDGDSLAYSLTGTDGGAFAVSSIGQLSVGSGTVLNYEQKASYSFNVVVSDGETPPLTATRAVTVTVSDINETLTISGLANVTVAENAAFTSGTPTVSGHRGTVTWTLEGTDAADFTIVGGTGVVSMIARNHEDPADANTDNVYEVTVKATDADNVVGTVSFTVTVTDVAESLVITGLANATVAENAAFTSATPTVSGHRGTVTWTLEGTDAADFTIDGGTGVVTMVARDHEDPADANTDSVYEVTVKATDADNVVGTVSFTVTVTDVNEAPAFATATALTLSVAEGTTGNIGSPVTATDPDGDSLGYSLTGTDAGAFEGSSTGQLSVGGGTVLNYEQKESYSFNVVVSDGQTPPLTATRAVAVTVTDVAESLVITGLANATVAENAAFTSATPTVSGHRGTVTWTLEGTDAADFTIDGGTGVVTMVARDHEDPADDNTDSVYEVTVKATDADSVVGTVSFTVTVTDVNEAPAFATATALTLSVAEGTTGNIGSPVTATDPDGDSLGYSLTGTDAGAFEGSSTGQLSVGGGTVLNYEQKATYSFNVVVSDGQTPALSATRAVTVTVTDIDETLTVTGLANATVAENAAWTSATPTVSGHNGAVTWTLEGTDAGDFTIVGATGVVSMIARDHEAPADDNTDNVYEVTVKVTDADDVVGTVSFTVTVTDVNEAPRFATATTLALSVAEGTTGNIGSPPVTASDPEGAALIYSLTGTDAGAFDVSSTGQLSVGSGTVLNFEQKASYSFNVRVSDGQSPPLTATRAVTVTVTDLGETLVITGLADATVAENAEFTSATPTVSGHRGAVTWTLDGTDAADFTITSATGVVSMVARDHEAPADANGDNVYELTVKATDADGIVGTVSFTVTVTDVAEPVTSPPPDPPDPPVPTPALNRAPEFRPATPLPLVVAEDARGDVGPPVRAIDPDGDDLAYSLAGADAAYFEIDEATAQIALRPSTILDRESRPAYLFAVIASDGELTARREVFVTVVDPEPPAETPAPLGPPLAPRNLDARLLTASVVLLTWDHDSGGEAGFVVLHRAGDDPWTALRSVPAGADQATIEDLDAGVVHGFLVAAVNAAGSSTSESASISLALAPPTHLDSSLVGPGGVRLTWRDNSISETGFVVEHRPVSQDDWTASRTLGANATAVTLDDLEPGRGHVFRVGAAGPAGVSFSLPGVFSVSAPPEPGSQTDCEAGRVAATLNGGYDVRMCFETPAGAQMDASNYHLEATASGLLYFFDRENVEVLVKVLDGCAINGHKWVFIAPVTTLAFDLEIIERSTGRRFTHRNPRSLTAETTSDTAAFPCETGAGTASAASTVAAGNRDESGSTPASHATPRPAPNAALQSRDDHPAPACEAAGPGIELEAGHRIDMCFVLPDGEPRPASDWGLQRRSSALLYFFDRENVEVLVKVLDGCGVNGHQWVFVAPVTDLAFNLVVTAPDGRTWTSGNNAGQTAATRTDTSAFSCR